MKVELNYLNGRLQAVDNGIAIDMDRGHTSEEIAGLLKEKNIIENIISILEKNQEYTEKDIVEDTVNKRRQDKNIPTLDIDGLPDVFKVKIKNYTS